MYCLMCGAADLHEFTEFNTLSRITSDCRPFRTGGRIAVCHTCNGIQKFPDSQWLEDIEEIYSQYNTFSVEGPLDQVVLDPKTNTLQPRCKVLGQKLMESTIPSCGRWLDYGCGRGAMLQAISNLLPNWELHGFDLDSQHLKYLESIKGFQKLHHTCDDEIDQEFDFISMIHSLEHFVNPLPTLERAQRLLRENGKLFIQVNDTRKNPFELVVADHLTHFIPETLYQVVQRAGFDIITLANDWITKEISLLAVPLAAGAKKPQTIHTENHSNEQVYAQVQWLTSLVELGETLSKDGSFGIFGSSVAATWLHNHLHDKVEFFIDEDPARIGMMHLGKPIYQPHEAPHGSRVLIGLIPEIAEAIQKKLQHLPLNFILPKALILD